MTPRSPRASELDVGDDRRAEERRSSSKFVLIERRTGYDRRYQKPETHWQHVSHWMHHHLRRRPSILFAVLVAANALSLLDFVLTLESLQAGAEEANPLLRTLFEIDFRLAGVVKVGLVASASLLIWRFRRYKRVVSIVALFVALFAAVVTYQAIYLLAV